LGYKLTDSTDLLLPWEITQNLDTKLLGKRAFYFDTIDSTQNFAAKIASNHNENGTIIISKHQTDGKGRLERKWESPTGGIWMSIITKPEFNISYITLVPIAASLALCIAIEKTLKIKPKLKWPNDILLKEKKVAGILLDTSVQSNKIENLVLGIGINFKINPHKLESSIKKTPNFYGVDTLVKKNEKPVTLVKQFLHELENIFQLIDSGYTKKIIMEWTIRSSTIGKNISIITNEGKIIGKAMKLDSDGALIISKGQKNKRLLIGDVIHKN
jgi:BirA family biotin operon repressor/biotin-[acetyl-CoA-carboxylase] ligase